MATALPFRIKDWTPVLTLDEKDPAYYIKDHSIVRDSGGRFHLYHIRGHFFEETKWNEFSELCFGHATSSTLEQWTVQEHVLVAHPEEYRIAAPHIRRDGGIWRMYYHRANPHAIMMAISLDLWTWQKHPTNPVFRPPAAPAGWSNGRASHPFVLAHAEGNYSLYYTTLVQEHGLQYSSIARAESTDLYHWHDARPVFISRQAGPVEATTTKSCSVVTRNGTYYLLYTDRRDDHLKIVPSNDPAHFDEADVRIVGPYYASRLIEADGRWYITHCYQPLSGHECRGLYLGHVEWCD